MSHLDAAAQQAEHDQAVRADLAADRHQYLAKHPPADPHPSEYAEPGWGDPAAKYLEDDQ